MCAIVVFAEFDTAHETIFAPNAGYAFSTLEDGDEEDCACIFDVERICKTKDANCRNGRGVN